MLLSSQPSWAELELLLLGWQVQKSALLPMLLQVLLMQGA